MRVASGDCSMRLVVYRANDDDRGTRMATTRKTKSATPPAKKWSQHVTETSDAMDLKPDVFKGHDPKAIAKSVKASAEHSDRRKSDPYRSAMSMLTFYINRAGHNLAAAQRKRLDRAKDELRSLFGKTAAPTSTSKKVPTKKAAAKKAATKKVGVRKAATRKTATKKTARKTS